MNAPPTISKLAEPATPPESEPRRTKQQTRLAQVAAALNERQRSYLLVAYAEDQRQQERHRGFGAAPARKWRWMEYGPDKAILLHKPDGALRAQLRKLGLVDSGSGSTWRSLVDRGLVELEWRPGITRRVSSLFVQMTREGRAVARALRGEVPRAKPAAGALSLTALRLIAHGQQHPGKEFEIQAPWPWGYPGDFMMLRMVARSLIKKGLCAGDDVSLRITPEGLKLDVAAQGSWVPMRERAEE